MLQCIAVGRAGELGAHLADAVAQRDHVVEPLTPTNSSRCLERRPADVDAALAHDPHRVGMKWLGMAAGAARRSTPRGAARRAPRPSASARCCPCTGTAPVRAPATAVAVPRRRAEPGVQRAPRRQRACPAAARGRRVVRVAPVRRAAPRGHEPALAQQAQVVRDEVLPLVRQLAELADPQVAAGELLQQSPPQRVRAQTEKGRDRRAHAAKNTSNAIDLTSDDGGTFFRRLHSRRRCRTGKSVQIGTVLATVTRELDPQVATGLTGLGRRGGALDLGVRRPPASIA